MNNNGKVKANNTWYKINKFNQPAPNGDREGSIQKCTAIKKTGISRHGKKKPNKIRVLFLVVSTAIFSTFNSLPVLIYTDIIDAK